MIIQQDMFFHFNFPHRILSPGLQRDFQVCLVEKNMFHVCRHAEKVKREIRRVDSEFVLNSTCAQLEYVTKSFVNLEH